MVKKREEGQSQQGISNGTAFVGKKKEGRYLRFKRSEEGSQASATLADVNSQRGNPQSGQEN